MPNMERRMYQAADIDLNGLAKALTNWFGTQGFESQSLPSQAGGLIVQARKESTWRTVLGMAQALTVQIVPQDDNLLVEIGGAKWMDKGVATGIGLLVLWPTLVTAGIGAWQQSQLDDRAWEIVENYISSHGGQAAVGPGAAPIATQTVPSVKCASCGATLRPGAKFCEQCGAEAPKPEPEPVCPACGEPVRPDSKFCDNCGASLTLKCAECGAELQPGVKFCPECGAKAQEE